MSRKQTLVVVTSVSILYFLFGYKSYYTHLRKHSEKLTQEIEDPMFLDPDLDNFLINTPGCAIPNYGLNMNYTSSKSKITCGKRAVFIRKISNEKIVFIVDTNELGKRTNKTELKPEEYRCCNMFAFRSDRRGVEDTAISYTHCETFTNGTIKDLTGEVIKVQCSHNKTLIYEDSYMLVKKVSKKKDKSNFDKTTNWNVILLGLDSMSRARLFATMPKLGAYLSMNDWIDYRGYNVVGRNTYPNIVSLLTGKKLSTMATECTPDMFACNKHFLWTKFREAGYATAYGEDYITLSDTFHPWNGFSTIPTDHYMRPLFLTGEQKGGALICTKHLSSGKHILNYAQDFADTYRNDSFFGFFWTNSFSHNPENQPSLFEDDVLGLLESLKSFENTFIVLLGDHGLQFGPDRLQMESYYDYRLPMLFMWAPIHFRQQHPTEFENLVLNQRRLISPYDMHLTLLKLSCMSLDISSEACPSCQALLTEVSPHRSCEAAGIGELYCSCHQMAATDIQENDTKLSLTAALEYVAEKSKTVATTRCMSCMPLELSKVLRSHSFTDSKKSKKYYVLAWEMKPRDVKYEVTVRKENISFTIVTDISGKSVVPLISYDVYGSCTKSDADKMWCVCYKSSCSNSVEN